MHTDMQKVPKTVDSCTENDIRISRHLSPHPNLCLVRALLPPPSLPPLSSPSHYLLRDCCGLGTLAEVLPSRRVACTPLQLRQLLLMCMVQVLSAVNILHTRGVCHRDIGLDCLYITQYGEHWIIKLGRFHYAIYHPGPVTRSSFIFDYQELQWLGGADSRLPPEILDTSESAHSLNYSGTDVFAVGCLFYEFLGLDNPFEVSPRLARSQYKASDLPSLPSCRLTTQRLVHLLLSQLPKHRPSPSTALVLCQALLWLPTHWLSTKLTELQLHHHLQIEQGSLVASLATMDLRPVPLPHILQADFLQHCHVPQLLQLLPLLHTT